MGDPIRPELPVKYRGFHDHEFLERGSREPILPISSAFIREEISTGKRDELYLEIELAEDEWEAVMAHPWLRQNVVPHLVQTVDVLVHHDEVAEQISDFFELETTRVEEMWTWYGPYDHVVLSQYFGAMVQLPRTLPMYTMDLRQWQQQLHMPRRLAPPKPEGQHNALVDVRWNVAMYEQLAAYAAARG